MREPYNINKRPRTLSRNNDRVIEILQDLISALEQKNIELEERLRVAEDRSPNVPE